MTSDRPIKVAIVAGEESGDLLGADLLRALESVSGRDVDPMGVGGRHLSAMGLKSLFDPGAIALMGVTAIAKDLPMLIARIGRTAKAIADAAPDCLITIDSPEFNLRVAKKVRARNPSIPIIHYVCPSIWAWRPSRAASMRPYVDHILCILPFEVDELTRLGGPPGTYVGHRLTHDTGILHAAHLQSDREKPTSHDEKTLLILPGSRKSEVKGLMGVFGETVALLRQRGHSLRLLLPTLPHLADLVEAQTTKWPQHPEIILDPVRKWQAFGEADAALAASGTVSLELALCRVPLLACYRMDRLMRLFARSHHDLVGLASQSDRGPGHRARILRHEHSARHACAAARAIDDGGQRLQATTAERLRRGQETHGDDAPRRRRGGRCRARPHPGAVMQDARNGALVFSVNPEWRVC